MGIEIKKSLLANSEIEKIDIIISDFQVTLLSYGASIYDIKCANITRVVAPSNIEEFLHSSSFFGKTVGRNAGRIKNGRIIVDGLNLTLDLNENKNHLHGGKLSLAFKNFKSQTHNNDTNATITFSLHDDNPYYQSVIDLKVTYIITYQRIEIIYQAKTSSPTILNLTNHTFFNLTQEETILNHKLKINSFFYGSMGNDLVCFKEKSVNKIFDFSTEHLIGTHIEDNFLQNSTALGYDHPYLLDGDYVFPILTLSSNDLKLDVFTTYDGVTIYSDNYPSCVFLTNGNEEKKYAGLAIEPQIFPLNIRDKVLLPGNEYLHKINYIFQKLTK